MDSRAELIEVIATLQQILVRDYPEPDLSARQLCWGAKVSQDFRDSVMWIEKELGIRSNYLMACIAFETGLTFSPSKRNPQSSATGLIQFMDATAKGLKTTTSALAKMTAVKQLGFVYYYFKAFGKNLSEWDLADTYMAILLPAMIGKPMNATMRWSNGAYRVNKGLDINKDGVITKAEAVKKVQALYDLGMQPENMA